MSKRLQSPTLETILMVCNALNDRPARTKKRSFWRDEDGSLIVFGLMLMLLMAIMGGLAVDLMRYEQRRTDIQQTLDRSVLAAASMTQKLNAVDVVNDYFAKAGLSQYLDSVTAPPGLNYRLVTASATSKVDTFFMHMIGFDELNVGAGSSAEQRATNVEISLVLDVSGSMAVASERIIALQAAAREFIDTVITDENQDRISISIVPYNGKVNLGPKLFAKFNTIDNHSYPDSYCIDLPASIFNNAEISRTTQLSQSPFADAFFSSSTSSSYESPLTPRQLWQGEGAYQTYGYNGIWCTAQSANYVRPFLNNKTQLKAYINDLRPFAATSIDLGIKWGLALLSPDFQPAISELSADGSIPSAERIPSIFANRPAQFKAQQTGPETTMKVIVLMTDGESSNEMSLKDGYKSGLSPIYRSSGDGKYSIYHANKSGSSKYYNPETGTWASSAYKNSGATAVQLTWPQVWQNLRVTWVAQQLYARPNPSASGASLSTRFSDQMNLMRDVTTATDKDTRLANACNIAKSKDVLIYGIAMDSSDHGKQQVENCSTSGSHYFEVTNLSVATAFRSIASNITALRLTQ